MTDADLPRNADLPLLPPKGDVARLWALAFMVLAPLTFGALALWLGQDTNWDIRNYHWYNAWAYMTGRYDSGVDFLPSGEQFFLNPWLNVPFYLLATHFPPTVAFFVLAVAQGLNFVLLFMLAYMTLIVPDTRRKTALCAALAVMGGLSAMGIAEAGTVLYDNVLSLGLLFSAVLVLRRLDCLLSAPVKAAVGRAMLCGIPAGFMTGLKLTGLPFCAGLCLALLFLTGDFHRCFRLAFAFGLGIAAGIAVAYGHWAWYLMAHYGSPMFPFFNILFHSPLLPEKNVILDYAAPYDLRLFAFPFFFGADPYLVNETWFRDLRIPVLYALLLVLAARPFFPGLKKPADAPLALAHPARFLLTTGIVTYVGWLVTEAVYRYLLPLDMLAPLLIVLCIGTLPGRRTTHAKLAGGLLALLIVTLQPGYWGRLQTWPKKLVDISRPALPGSADIMILMAGYDAYAYLLPEFPPQISFVRIQSRAFHPEYPYGINDLIRKKIAAHKGKLMLLIPAREIKTGAAALGYYNLSLAQNTCQTVTDNLYEEHLVKTAEAGDTYSQFYKLCDVTRKGGRQR